MSQTIKRASEPLAWGAPSAWWVLTATVLGSAMTFVDATVVSIALPSIGADLGAGPIGMTWVVTSYTLSLAALILLGGSLSDQVGHRRVFVAGVVLFTVASALCGLAFNIETLIAARAAQGVGGALLTPASLAILQSTFAPEYRARAIGAWSGLTGVAAALGPLLGGWMVEAASWRWVFLINVPVAVLVIAVALRHVAPPSSHAGGPAALDWIGAILLAVSLGTTTYALTAWSPGALTTWNVGGPLAAGILAIAVFGLRERTVATPLLPPNVFRSHLFVALNVITFLIYAALGAVFFGLVITLQVGSGFSPLAAGLSLMPVTLLMLLFSASAGRLMERAGPALPVTVGALIAATGVALLSRVDRDADYLLDVLLPTSVFGAGLTLFVAPLTSTVLEALPPSQAGLASGVNNAVARTANLVAVAAIPAVGALGGTALTDPAQANQTFALVARLCSALLVAAAGLAAATLIGSRHALIASGQDMPRRCSHPASLAGIAAVSGTQAVLSHRQIHESCSTSGQLACGVPAVPDLAALGMTLDATSTPEAHHKTPAVAAAQSLSDSTEGARQ